MALAMSPKATHRLRNGSTGTEYQACLETLRRLEAEQRYLDERIELLRLRMQTAEGAP